jgi:hypothetical protein
MRATYSDFPENPTVYRFVFKIKNLIVQIKLRVQFFITIFSVLVFDFTYVNLWRYACQQAHPRALSHSLVQRINLDLGIRTNTD